MDSKHDKRRAAIQKYRQKMIAVRMHRETYRKFKAISARDNDKSLISTFDRVAEEILHGKGTQEKNDEAEAKAES